MAMNTEDYKTNARESGIMVGDYVQITRKAEYGENGWYIGWAPEKDKTINDVGQVTMIDAEGNFFVYFENIDDWFLYPYFVLRRVHRTPTPPRFNIGDRVLIKRAWEEGECGTRVKFTDNKLKTIGKVVEIVEVLLTDNNEFTYSVNFENRDVFSYPEFVLREVTNKPNPDFEFEPFDTLLHITGPTLSR